MLREVIIQEWTKLREEIWWKQETEAITKAEVDNIQQQEFAQKTKRIIDLESCLERSHQEWDTFCRNLIEVLDYLERGLSVKSEVEEMEKVYLLRKEKYPQWVGEEPTESSSRSAVKGNLNALFALLKKLGQKGLSEVGPTLEEVD